MSLIFAWSTVCGSSVFFVTPASSSALLL